MGEKIPLELLVPARDVAVAKEGILAGADSVYIGASRFGARAAAGNSVADIAELCDFAHVYGARVYAAINTILTDSEVAQACALIDDLYEAGVDAAIVQDMGLLEKCKSAMVFHASTQCHISTPQKARFLSACGFDTLVLARELSLDEIRAISAAVDNRLECFVHGALCVSYSGQCYLSAAIGGRSGNRGQCAQPCRMKYRFEDSRGREIAAPAYFLSLRDMNRSASIAELAEAGVSVFKIEGRLKNAEYVKNITAYYRKIIDGLIGENPEKYARASFGETSLPFEPDPRKTFSRTFTQYHLHGICAGNESFATPKARGEFIGRVGGVFDGGFSLAGAQGIFSNGDGLFFDGKTQLGACVSGVRGDDVFVGTPSQHLKISPGSKIWRNRSASFEKLLKLKVQRRRKILVEVLERGRQWIFRAATPQGDCAEVELPCSCQVSENFAAASESLRRNLSKFGDTAYLPEIEISAARLPYLKPAQINAIRRSLVQKLTENILSNYDIRRRALSRKPPQKIEFKEPPLSQDCFANIYNSYARQFYKKMGFDISASAPETLSDFGNLRVMTTRHCILRELGMCKKINPPKNFKEPFFLTNESARLRIKFDCLRCGMDLFFDG